MSRRLTRQEIKHDEVRDTLASIFWWIESHYRQILLGIAVLIVLGLIGTAFYVYMEGLQERAQEALAAALPELPEPDATAPAADEIAQQRTAAVSALAALREEYGGTDAARIGGAYLGSLHASDGDTEQARELWREYAAEQRPEALGAVVQVNLWTLDREEGRAEAVAGEIEQRLRNDSAMPGDLLLHELALTYEKLERTADAGDTWQRLIDEYPQSAFSITARRRVAALGSS
jgi:hypothetical protein